MANVFDLARKYAEARGAAPARDSAAAAVVADVRGGHMGVGIACSDRGYCVTDDDFLSVTSGKQTFCTDCGAPLTRPEPSS